MKIKFILLIASSLLICTLLQACGGSNSTSVMAPPAGVQPKTLDTAQVQALTQTTLETDDPMAVNDGLITVAGNSDDSADPVMVTGP